MKKDILDILFWLLLAIALGFIILKVAGIIHSPDWISYIPVITIIFAAGIAYQKTISFMNIMQIRTSYFKKKIDKIDERITNNEKRLLYLESKQNLRMDNR